MQLATGRYPLVSLSLDVFHSILIDFEGGNKGGHTTREMLGVIIKRTALILCETIKAAKFKKRVNTKENKP